MVTASPTTRKRGSCNRAINGFRVRTVADEAPTSVAVEKAVAEAFHDVVESGYCTLTLAVPLASVARSGRQRMVLRKSVRTLMATPFACGDGATTAGGGGGGMGAIAAAVSIIGALDVTVIDSATA